MFEQSAGRNALLQESAYEIKATPDAGVAREWLNTHYSPHELTYASGISDFNFLHVSAPIREGTANLLRYGSRVDIAPEPFADFYMLEMPLAGGADITMNAGKTCSSSQDCALFLPPHTPLSSCWRTGTLQFMLKLEARQVQKRWRELVRDPLARLPSLSPVISFESAEGWRVQQSMMLLCREFERSAQFNQPALTKSPLSAAVIDSVLEYVRVRHGPHIDPEGKVPLPAALRRSVLYLRAHLSDDIRMADLVSVSGVSERSLFNQFDEFLNITPMRYLESKRLERAREELLAGKSGVAEIARRVGFRHMGRFSLRYRKAYGETPSQTLSESRCYYPDPETNGVRPLDVQSKP